MSDAITVNDQPQQFYLACDKWTPAFGHGIKVGDYQFCAIPLSTHINISEVTSGAHVLTIPMNDEIMESTETKEGSLKFFRKVGEKLKSVVEKDDYDFEKELKKMRQISFERLGKMPEIKEVDIHVD